MSQSNVIAGALFISFVFYITARGELRTYLGFFGVGSGGSSGSTASPNTTITGVTGAVSSGASVLTSIGNSNPFSGAGFGF